VRAVSLKPGDTVAVSGAAGRRWIDCRPACKTSCGGGDRHRESGQPQLVGRARHQAGGYGEGLADRLREARIKAFIDTHGGGYVKLAIELGVAGPDQHMHAEPHFRTSCHYQMSSAKSFFSEERLKRKDFQEIVRLP
jgi:hypothetical protein